MDPVATKVTGATGVGTTVISTESIVIYGIVIGCALADATATLFDNDGAVIVRFALNAGSKTHVLSIPFLCPNGAQLLQSATARSAIFYSAGGR